MAANVLFDGGGGGVVVWKGLREVGVCWGGDALGGLDKVLAGQVWRCHTCRIDDLIGRLGGVCCREWLDGGAMSVFG